MGRGCRGSKGGLNAFLFQFLLRDFGQRGGGWVKGPPLLESAPPLKLLCRAHQEKSSSVCGAAAVGSLLLSQCSFIVDAASESTRYNWHSRAMRMRVPRSNQPERLDGELQYISQNNLISRGNPLCC